MSFSFPYNFDFTFNVVKTSLLQWILIFKKPLYFYTEVTFTEKDELFHIFLWTQKNQNETTEKQADEAKHSNQKYIFEKSAQDCLFTPCPGWRSQSVSHL